MSDSGVYPFLGTNDLYTLPLNLAVTHYELPRTFIFLAVGGRVFPIPSLGLVALQK